MADLTPDSVTTNLNASGEDSTTPERVEYVPARFVPFTISEDLDLYDLHNLDTSIWCLFCHKEGHQAQSCPQGAFVNEEVDRWELLSRARMVPQSSEPNMVNKFINLLFSMEAQEADIRQHVAGRDALYLNIYQAMTDWHTPLEHEQWFHIMSGCNRFMAGYFSGSFSLGHETLTALKEHMQEGGTVSTFIERVPPSEIQNILSKIRVEEEIKAILEQNESGFRYRIVKWYRSVREYVDTSPEFLDLDPADRSWIRKAFFVMLDCQPNLELNDLYGLRWTFPNVDDVVRNNGLEL